VSVRRALPAPETHTPRVHLLLPPGRQRLVPAAWRSADGARISRPADAQQSVQRFTRLTRSRCSRTSEHRAQGLLRETGPGGRLVTGYIYPNEFESSGLLIVLYRTSPGSSPEHSSWPRSSAVQRARGSATYRLALLTALAFLLIAPLPLLAHLGHPSAALRSSSRRTCGPHGDVGFVYAWYLAVVLVLEIWFDYRKTWWSGGSRRGDSRRLLLRPDARCDDVSRALCDSTTAPADHHADRIRRVPAPRLRRVHLRIDQGEPWWSSCSSHRFLFSRWCLASRSCSCSTSSHRCASKPSTWCASTSWRPSCSTRSSSTLARDARLHPPLYERRSRSHSEPAVSAGSSEPGGAAVLLGTLLPMGCSRSSAPRSRGGRAATTEELRRMVYFGSAADSDGIFSTR